MGLTRQIRSRITIVAVLAAGLPLMAGTAHAALTISKNATANVTCKNGVCKATAKKAVLNVSQLQKLLASSNVSVVSGKAAGDIDAAAALSWKSGKSLTLDAYGSIAVSDPVAVKGPGGLALLTDDGGTGGTLSFSGKGAITFKGSANELTINGISYVLANTLAGLASDIAANPSGTYALAAAYNAGNDGTYSSSPIPTGFTGSLQGLGNRITNLSINDTVNNDNVGLFSFIAAGGSVINLGVTSVNVTGSGAGALVGALVGLNNGVISNVYTSGNVAAGGGANVGGLVGRSYQGAISGSYSSASITDTADNITGGLVGFNQDTNISTSYATGAVVGGINHGSGGLVGGNFTDGGGTATISQCFATGAVSAGANEAVGGLVGGNRSSGGTPPIITESWATGAATSNGSGTIVGGLAGYNDGAIQNSYAMGAATAASNEQVGGLVGQEDTGSSVADSYSTGAVTGGSGTYIGGLLGYDNSGGANSDAYWDTATSGVTNLSQGAGNIANDAGITGLTTAQLQGGLPAGFAKSIWTEKGSINGGLPYLIDNPPPK